MNAIRELKDHNGVLVTELWCLARITESYFVNLFSFSQSLKDLSHFVGG